MKMTKENREHLQQNLITMADSYPEDLINQLCQVVVDYVKPVSTPLAMIKKQFFDYVYNRCGDELFDGEIERWIMSYIEYLEHNCSGDTDENWTQFMNGKIQTELE